MWRLLQFVVLLAVVVAAAVWVADRPGEVQLDWLGYEIKTHVGFLILAVVLLMVVAALAYHAWRKLLAAPRAARQAMEASRRRRGYQALTNGLVAVAAGDSAEARKWAKRSERLLDEPPLNMLLSAQAAQLADDQIAARQHFEAMLARPETRFLGLRGLVQQALKRGDSREALGYVEEAYRLRPQTPWVLETLFDLSEREGRLQDAARVLGEAKRRRALPAAEADRRRAVVLVEEALASEREGQLPPALDRARAALRLAPDLTAAAHLAAKVAKELGKSREAERILERAWTTGPHPDLARLYLSFHPEATAAQRLRLLQRLTGGQPQHLETRLALAEAAIAAGLWDEARKQLEPLQRDPADARVALATALLAESESGDHATARRWRERAAALTAPPLWTCGLCGATTGEWHPRCPACGGFDSLAWKPGPLGLVPIQAPAIGPDGLDVRAITPPDDDVEPPARQAAPKDSPPKTSPETTSPETAASEKTAPEKTSPEKKGSEKKGSEKKSSEKKSPEKKSPEKKGSEESTASDDSADRESGEDDSPPSDEASEGKTLSPEEAVRRGL